MAIDFEKIKNKCPVRNVHPEGCGAKVFTHRYGELGGVGDCEEKGCIAIFTSKLVKDINVKN